MPYTHFPDVGDKSYNFAYDIDADNPVLRFGAMTSPISYIPSYFAAGMDPILQKIVTNR